MAGRLTKKTADGVPRWVAAAGALVAIGGLIWSVASHFIPQTLPEKPSSAVTSGAPGVQVEGTGNVGVGVMNGGQITVGSSVPQEPNTQSQAAP